MTTNKDEYFVELEEAAFKFHQALLKYKPHTDVDLEELSNEVYHTVWVVLADDLNDNPSS